MREPVRIELSALGNRATLIGAVGSAIDLVHRSLFGIGRDAGPWLFPLWRRMLRHDRASAEKRSETGMSWGQRDFMVPGRSLAVGDRGMVAASHPAVALAAVEILRSGGNAVDAAIAAIALQGVIDPHMTGIGGDCFAIYAPASGKPVAINGSGRAPAKAELGWFREAGMASIPDDSPHAVTIPGRSMPGAGSLPIMAQKGWTRFWRPRSTRPRMALS